MSKLQSDYIQESELRKAIEAYGLVADSIERIPKGCYALVYKIRCGDKDYIVRIRNEMATEQDIIFARKWGQAVSAEVPVPIPLMPLCNIPRIANRCVEIAPYIEHDSDNVSDSLQAWVTVGEWVGRMHRLGMPLLEEAPIDLPYGNYPNDGLINTYKDHFQIALPDQKLHILQAEELLKQSQHFIEPYRKSLISGVVHGDMHFWNVLYSEGNPVAIIDLDFLQRGYLIADIAYACIWLDAWESERGAEWAGVMEKYIKAYEFGRQSQLNIAERECLLWFRLLIHISFFFQSSWGEFEEGLKDLQTAKELAQRYQLGIQ
jgi:Ser/Thr protein kinase RdoA (MazF antagonist)